MITLENICCNSCRDNPNWRQAQHPAIWAFLAREICGDYEISGGMSWRCRTMALLTWSVKGHLFLFLFLFCVTKNCLKLDFL